MASLRPFTSSATLVVLALLASLLSCGESPPLEEGAAAIETAPPAVHALDAPAGPYAPTTVVATVGTRQITLSELAQRFAALSDGTRQAYLASDAPLERFLRDVTSNLLIVVEAEALDLGSDPMYETLLERKREDVLRDLYARRTLLGAFDEDALRARYQSQLQRFSVEAQVHLRHILITPGRWKGPLNESGEDVVGEEAARTRADELRAEILGGGDFAIAARRSSEDATARLGGDLGWVQPSSLPPELAEVATTLRVGEISEVVASDHGFHVVEVLARREAGVIPFEVVRELLLQEAVAEYRQELARQAAEDRDRLTEKHGIELYLDRLPW